MGGVLDKIVNLLKECFVMLKTKLWSTQWNLNLAIRTSVCIAVVAMVLYTAMFILPPISKEGTNAITGTSVASDTTLSISITNSALSLDLTPTSANGTFNTTSSPATIHVATNNITGYTLGIRASTSSDTASLLVNTIDQCDSTPTSTKCSLSSLTTSVSETDYSASTATDLNNTWGYLPSYYNSVSNTDYLPAPTTGDIINTTTGPNLPNTTNSTNNTSNDTNTSNAADELVPDEYTINLGTRIDYTPYAGNYTNTFIVTAVGNPVPYSVSYDSNIPTPAASTNTVSNMPNAQVGEVSSGDTVAVLLSTNTPTLGHTNPSTGQYEYAGYGFMGWCSEPTETIDDGTSNGYQACPTTATLYQPGDAFGIDQTEHNTQMLYAVWGYATTITFDANAPEPDVIGEMPVQVIPGGTTRALANSTYVRTGYYFVGWNTDPNAYMATYANAANYTAKADESLDITLYAIWTSCPADNICYSDNGANSPITMGNQSASSNTATTLWAYNFKYDTNNDGYNDYGFVGWSEDKNAATKIADNDTDNDPVIYGPNQDITTGDLAHYGMQLYAVWVAPVTDSANNILTFQTPNLLTISLADGTTLLDKPINYVTALKDYRDNQVYAVAKLADENYWMIENLRLESEATVGNNKNDSSITNQSLAEGYGGVFVGLADAESEHFDEDTTANSLYSTTNIVGDNQGNRIPRYNNINTAEAAAYMADYDLNTNVYSLGNYYNWAATIADTSNYTDIYGHTDVATSICPAGWHLPYGGNGTTSPNLGGASGGFSYLDKKMGGTGGVQINVAASNRWRTFPNNFIYSGVYNGSDTENRAFVANYKSTSANADTLAYLFRGLGSGVYPGTGGGYKANGHSVRCLATR